MTAPPRIAITAGEPAGIGPDLCLQLAQAPQACDLVCIGDRDVLAERARQLQLPIEITAYASHVPPTRTPAGVLPVLHLPCAARVVPGQLAVANAAHVVAILQAAAAGAASGEFAAIVTAPVQKSVINDAGLAFSGHTEFFAAATGSALPVMLLAAGDLRVALATTHLPLARVSAAITRELIEQILTILDRDLRQRFGIAHPRIAVCGLNPHAGEAGHLGGEDQESIAPAIAAAQQRGIDARGPWPADTIFLPRLLAHCDVVLAMYHDQGLPVLKFAGFGQAVNVTLGLPIVRTSVDHGTALDLAGTGAADAGSLRAALQLALHMVAVRK